MEVVKGSTSQISIDQLTDEHLVVGLIVGTPAILQAEGEMPFISYKWIAANRINVRRALKFCNESHEMEAFFTAFRTQKEAVYRAIEEGATLHAFTKAEEAYEWLVTACTPDNS